MAFLSLSPFKAATSALAASSVQPEGAAVVSGSPGEGLFATLRATAAGYVQRAAASTAELLKPANLFVPGGTAATKAAANTVDAAATVAKSAGTGIKQGLTFGIAAVVVLAFLFLRNNLK